MRSVVNPMRKDDELLRPCARSTWKRLDADLSACAIDEVDGKIGEAPAMASLGDIGPLLQQPADVYDHALSN